MSDSESLSSDHHETQPRPQHPQSAGGRNLVGNNSTTALIVKSQAADALYFCRRKIDFAVIRGRLPHLKFDALISPSGDLMR